MSATEPARDPKVSVIVPVYNPGSHIDDCIRTILGQTLGPQEYEAIFVDDGSTDGTGERLDRLADEHENVTTLHIPNSGWPGRPRNVGMDAARGEFLYFVDNDDFLEPDALERLYATAVRDEADIVMGKVVGHRRSVAREIFRVDRTRIRVQDELKLLTMLTPHKLFRASLIEDHGLRYPEGRRRLEDHVFVLQAYFAAGAVSVLSDYPVYNWVRREDETNASSVPPDRGYWENLDEVLDIAEANSEPGTYRDRLFAHWYRSKVLRRVDGQHLAAYSQEFQERLLADIREVVLPRFSPAVGRRTEGVLKLRDTFVRAGRLDGLQAVADLENAIEGDVRVTATDWDGGTVQLHVEGTLTAGGQPLVFPRRPDGRLSWPLPEALRAVPELADEDWDVTARLPKAKIRALVRGRKTRIEYLLPAETEAEVREAEGGATIVVRGTIRFDPATAAAGHPIRDGVWDLNLLFDCFGLHVWTRLKADRLGDGSAETDLIAAPGILGEPARAVIPIATVTGNATIDVGGVSRKLAELAPPAADRAAVARAGDGLTLDIPFPGVLLPDGTAAGVLALRQAAANGDEPATVPATVVPAPGGEGVRLRATLPPGMAGEGRWRLALHLDGRAERLPLALEVPRDGDPHLVRAAGEPGAHPLPTRVKRALLKVPAIRSAADRLRGRS